MRYKIQQYRNLRLIIEYTYRWFIMIKFFTKKKVKKMVEILGMINISNNKRTSEIECGSMSCDEKMSVGVQNNDSSKSGEPI